MADDQDTLVKLNLRLRESTREQLEAAADVSGRSLNAEILARLKDSLRADDAFGGEEQAWLLAKVTAVMNEVSAELSQPWWKSYTGWQVVFRSCYYLIKQYRPQGRKPLQDLLTEDGWQEVQRWNETYADAERSRLEEVQRRIDLRITKDALKDEYATRQFADLEKEPADRAPPPNLAPSDMEIWAGRQAEIEQKVGLFRQVLPFLRSARRRRRNRRSV